jgi:hypothetical protein
MQKDTQNKEKQFISALTHNESKPKPQGRKRPITSTQPGKMKNKQVIDYSKDDSDNEIEVTRTYEQYNQKEYKFNSDLNVNNDQQESDDVIDFMNHKQTKYNQPINKYSNWNQQRHIQAIQEPDISQPEAAEFDYLDYDSNLQNLRKINEEQAKFDYMDSDLDS